ncbi:MAG: PadR family transcriptional regulator [Clostridia bacterium]|nr:PadR family transcriptional regulator [Clostridia bacterium]
MDAQLKKGLTDVCVLAALKKGESYGYKIVSELFPCIVLSESTLYPVLRRLEARGEVSSRVEVFSGRVRKYYAITPEGVARLERFSETAATFQKITEYIQNGGKI